jgi:potassium-transporting ATPase KdpC subunit
MMRTAFRGLVATVVLAVITGLLYPLAITGLAQLILRHKAEGSLVTSEGRVVGSPLIGQAWEEPKWFYGRPSAIAEPYDASTSSGSNLGPSSKDLAAAFGERLSAIMKLEDPYHPGLKAAEVPVDLVTASGSGLDPHISPAAALFQARRIADARNVAVADVERLVRDHTEGRTLGFLGQPRVNVLELNLALEQGEGR